jgi:hypothetical protein
MNNQLAAGRDADRRERNTTTTTGSVIAAIVAYVDRATSHTLTDHIRAGYPTYAQAQCHVA